jgi:hypothetical protein
MKFRTHLSKAELCFFALTFTFTLLFHSSQPVQAATRFTPAYDFADTSGDTLHGSQKFNSITSDGRYLAFATERSGLVSGDTDSLNYTDVYLIDLKQPNRFILVSTAYNSSGPANSFSDQPSISDESNGRIKVVFRSLATNIINNSSIPAVSQIYVKEYDTSNFSLVSTTLVSVDPALPSPPTNTGLSRFPRISRNGQFVVFVTASSFNSGDTTTLSEDIYRRDLSSSQLLWISQRSGIVSGSSDAPAISSTGRYVVFSSTKSLISGVSTQQNVYLWDDQVTVQPFDLISANTSGTEANQRSGYFLDTEYGCDVSAEGN